MNIKKLIKNTVNNKYIFFLISLLFFYWISFHLPLIADDLGYSLVRGTTIRQTNILQVLNSTWEEYLNWEGRLACYFLAELFLSTPNQILFRLLYPLVNTAIIYQIYKLVFVNENSEEQHYIYLYLIFSLFLFAHSLVLNQTLFWIMGWCTYVLPFLFMFPGLCILRKAYSEDGINIPKKKKIALFFTQLIACLFVEHYSLVVLSYSLIYLCISLYKKKNVSICLILFIGALVGSLIILLCPGVLKRLAVVNVQRRFSDMIHFGWSRFIYTFFTLNLRIFALISFVLSVHFLSKKRLGLFISLANLVVVGISIMLIIKPSFLNPVLIEALTQEWSYFIVQKHDLYKYSILVIYTIIVHLISFAFISYERRDLFPILTYLASFMSSFCFIVTEMACERTQFISYVFLVVLLVMLLKESHRSIQITLQVMMMLILIYNVVKFSVAYKNEWDIYQNNVEKFQACSLVSCKEVRIKEHNYRYVFKSDLDFNKQKGWVHNHLRSYFNLPEDTIILPE